MKNELTKNIITQMKIWRSDRKRMKIGKNAKRIAEYVRNY